MTIETLRKEHRELIPDYSGSPISPVGPASEKMSLKRWAQFEREQAERFRLGVGVELDDWLEENK